MGPWLYTFRRTSESRLALLNLYGEQVRGEVPQAAGDDGP